jgi:hypothetical protein
MDSLEELTKSNGKTGFFKHVFNFDDESKLDMLNIIQYSVLAILPLVLFNKSLQKLVPEANDEKHSIELSMEVIAQVIVVFLGMLIIHRIITFVPTYSGAKYVDFNVTNIVLSVLIILLSLQTKLGEKISILADRVVEFWNGNVGDKKKKKNKNAQKQQQQSNEQAISQSLDSTQINSLPAQQQPNFNQMYQNDNTPLIGASTPGSDMVMEPMAANSMGGAFGSLF